MDATHSRLGNSSLSKMFLVLAGGEIGSTEELHRENVQPF